MGRWILGRPQDIWPNRVNWCHWTGCRSSARFWRSLQTWTTEESWFEFFSCQSCTSFPTSQSDESSRTWQTGQSATASTPVSGVSFVSWMTASGAGAICSLLNGSCGIAEYDGFYDTVSTRVLYHQCLEHKCRQAVDRVPLQEAHGLRS